MASNFSKEFERFIASAGGGKGDGAKTQAEQKYINDYDWFITVRSVQGWARPEISENTVLDMLMEEFMSVLHQMEMEKNAIEARRKHDQKEADQKAKAKSKK